ILEALEAENFGPLGADVYARGHLRRYAELLGESPAQLQDLYASAAPAARPDLTSIPRGERAPATVRWQLPALLAVAALALAGLVWWLLTLPGPAPHAVSAPTRVAAAQDQAGPPAAAGGEASAGKPTDAAAPGEAAGAGEARLSLKLSDASWVQVSDGHGRRLVDGLLAAASERTVTGAPPLRVVLGNASPLTLALNRRPPPL